ncbi:MAG: hypothetical protein AAB923_03500 [Patescibacteria group bacterium]
MATIHAVVRMIMCIRTTTGTQNPFPLRSSRNGPLRMKNAE